MEYDYIFKIILVGDHNSGKTTFFKNLLEYSYNVTETCPTIGVDYAIKYTKKNKQTIKVNIWDTAGQERFKAIIINYFRGISGILLFFDLNNYNTFKSLEKWIKEIKNNNSCIHSHPIILIGNKSDLVNVIPIEELNTLINKYNLIYYQTSVYECNYFDIFQDMITQIYNTFIKNDIICEGIKNNTQNNNIIDVNMINKNKKYMDKCCVIS